MINKLNAVELMQTSLKGDIIELSLVLSTTTRYKK